MTDESVPAPAPKIRRILWACTLAVIIFLSFTAGYMVAISRMGETAQVGDSASRPAPSVKLDTPTVILSEAHDPVGQRTTIYEDTDYIFVAGDYGPKGKQVPGLFVFSHKMKKWMEIRKLSTRNARLGRSPTSEEGLCSVGWDYSDLRKADYATIPLMTSGSVNLPDKILYQADTATYLLQFNSSWNIDAVLTQFTVKKDHVDKSFGEGTGSVP